MIEGQTVPILKPVVESLKWLPAPRLELPSLCCIALPSLAAKTSPLLQNLLRVAVSRDHPAS